MAENSTGRRTCRRVMSDGLVEAVKGALIGLGASLAGILAMNLINPDFYNNTPPMDYYQYSEIFTAFGAVVGGIKGVTGYKGIRD